jgi:hypothetical protein
MGFGVRQSWFPAHFIPYWSYGVTKLLNFSEPPFLICKKKIILLCKVLREKLVCLLAIAKE